MNEPFLYDYQMDAVNQLRTGCILNGGVGSGKSRTGLYYYFKENGGSFIDQNYIPMSNPKDLYIITTAMKRDNKEWLGELANYRMSDKPELNYYDNKIVIDSWNNIQKYADIEQAFFIFDEDRVTGTGVWVKSFLKIAKANDWIILSATPGDTWEQYIPVFLANGFYKNKTEFYREHIVKNPYVKWKIDRYLNTGRLIRLRNRILIDMDFTRHTIPHHEDVYVRYNTTLYKDTIKTRTDPFNKEYIFCNENDEHAENIDGEWMKLVNKSIPQASVLCYILRQIVNSDESRQIALLDICADHPRVIVFYNFDYERDILLNLGYINDGDAMNISEWSGHAHQPIPNSKKWVYLVQYTAGCEGWNCIKTDTIVFFSQNYSYKVVTQAAGRIDRLNSPYKDLYYYHLKSRSGIDLAISKALSEKKKFNETRWIKW